jgi:hypothetical protein
VPVPIARVVSTKTNKEKPVAFHAPLANMKAEPVLLRLLAKAIARVVIFARPGPPMRMPAIAARGSTALPAPRDPSPLAPI